ncbi:MAG TPA: ABC transporter ATP-binding protein [Hyphomicrobiaceae bacterium]|jgi:lipoprotein-releasing system ATP-binding protein|nr:ABC transporter ATP-binding protein [Hyphomicrobiaceae bacterium]
MTPILRAEKLTRILPGFVPVTLVEGIDLEIGKGEFVAIMGPSGSGKSSLLYLLGLLDIPTSGTLWLNGRHTVGLDEDALADIRLRELGFVFQFHFLLAEFTALDNVMLPMRRSGALPEEEAQARAFQLLKSLGLAAHANKYPSQLSGGERQRVAIARALSNDPLIILADEPTGALDTKASGSLRDSFRELAHEKKCTIVAVTHDPSFAKAADRIVYLVDGRLQPPDRAAELFTMSIR